MPNIFAGLSELQNSALGSADPMNAMVQGQRETKKFQLETLDMYKELALKDLKTKIIGMEMGRKEYEFNEYKQQAGLREQQSKTALAQAKQQEVAANTALEWEAQYGGVEAMEQSKRLEANLTKSQIAQAQSVAAGNYDSIDKNKNAKVSQWAIGAYSAGEQSGSYIEPYQMFRANYLRMYPKAKDQMPPYVNEQQAKSLLSMMGVTASVVAAGTKGSGSSGAVSTLGKIQEDRANAAARGNLQEYLELEAEVRKTISPTEGQVMGEIADKLKNNKPLTVGEANAVQLHLLTSPMAGAMMPLAQKWLDKATIGKSKDTAIQINSQEEFEAIRKNGDPEMWVKTPDGKLYQVKELNQ